MTQKGFASGHGYQEDVESGYKLLGHRYYDPESGRFLSRDPIHDGRNWYAYAENNPIQIVDPNGLEPAGHHINPKEVWADGVSPEASGVFDAATTGPISPELNRWDKPHREYNAAVKDLWQDFLKKRKIDPSKMTAAQAEEFLKLILNSKDPRIASFLAKIYASLGRAVPKIAGELGAHYGQKLAKLGIKIGGKKAMTGLARAAKFLGEHSIILTLDLFANDWCEGGFKHAVNELCWPFTLFR